MKLRPCLFSAAVVMLFCGVAFADEFTESFTLRADELHLVNLVGEIRVEPASGDEFEIRIEVKGDDASREYIEIDVDKGREAVVSVVFPVDKQRKYVYPEMGRRKTTISFNDGPGDKSSWLGKILRGLNGDRITVSGRGKGLEVWADVTVGVPRGRMADVRLGVGGIKAEGVKGDLVLDINSGSVAAHRIEGSVLGDTGSGSVDFSEIKGDVDADTGSGSVTIQHCTSDRVHADTGSGSVRVEDVDCDKLHVDTGSGGVTALRIRTDAVHIDTGSGTVKLELLRMGRGKYIIDTGSGGIDLTMPKNASARVSADTGSGGVSVDIEGVDIGRKQRNELSFTVGDGDSRVVLDTGSGGIRVRTR